MVHKPDLASVVCELFPSGGVLAFGSFGHGHGRSTLANETFKLLKNAGIPTFRLSTGAIFRRIAEEHGFSDILSFSQYLQANPAEARKIDFKIDREVIHILENYNGQIIVLDSNLHVHPAILRDILKIKDFFTFYVHTPDEVLGKRLVATNRKGERKYSCWKDAVRAQRKRTIADIARYITYIQTLREGTLRKFYTSGVRIMARLYIADVLFDDPTFLSHIARKLNQSTRLAIIDNSGSIKESLKQISDALAYEGNP